MLKHKSQPSYYPSKKAPNYLHRFRQIGYLVLTSLASTNTMAAHITLDGGKVDVSTRIFIDRGHLYDNPTAVQIQSGSTSTSTDASIIGVYNDDGYVQPVSATAYSNVEAQYDATGLTHLEFANVATSRTAHIGPGVYLGGESSSDTELMFTVLSKSRAELSWWTDYSTAAYGYIHDNDVENDIAIFCHHRGFCENPSSSIELFLDPGRYTIYTGVGSPDMSADYGYGSFSDESHLVASFSPVPVPLPASIWLFLSGLILPLTGMLRRLSSNT